MEEQEYIQHFKRKRKIATAIILCSLTGVFVSGYHFDLFGNKIDFVTKPANYLFYGFILLGIFGLLLTIFSKYTALILTILSSGIYFLIFILGKISRGEL